MENVVGVVLQNGALEGGVLEDLSPCWVTSELGFVAESDFELVGIVCCTVDSVAFGYCVRVLVLMSRTEGLWLTKIGDRGTEYPSEQERRDSEELLVMHGWLWGWALT